MIPAFSMVRFGFDPVSRIKCKTLYVTGGTDFMLIVSARDMSDYEAFTRDFFYNNADIKGFKTTVVMDRIKASFLLPM